MAHSLSGDSAGKESYCNARDIRDTGSVPGLGRSPGEGNGNQLQYPCPGNLRDRGLRPWGHRELNTPEHILHMIISDILSFGVQIHC